MKNIVLIGFSGSGKSTIGPKLAKRLSLEYFDLDNMIESKRRMNITEIFKQSGEKIFRELEFDLLKRIINSKKQKLIALGGGAYQNKEIRLLCSGNSIVVYLSCSQRELYKRLKNSDDRPLLHGNSTKIKEKIRSLMSKRKKNYQSADIIVSTTNKKITEVVTEIKRKVLAYADC